MHSKCHGIFWNVSWNVRETSGNLKAVKVWEPYTDELRVMTGLEDITVCMRRNRLRWYGHVVRKEESDWVKRAWSGWDIEGRRPRGRPKKTWDATIKEDCSQLRLNREDAKNRAVWRSKIANVLPRDRDRGRKR